MKRVLLLLLVSAGIAFAAPKVGSTVTIRVLSAKVMKAPKFIGSAAGTVSRGEQLVVKEVKGDWYRVAGSSTGWIHKTNVTEGKVQLSSTPGGAGGNVNRDEVELAGRGFTPEVEQKYKQGNPNLDFSHVDLIEKTEIDPAELEAFVTEGGLQ
jgi:Bacterial SH3 domain